MTNDPTFGIEQPLLFVSCEELFVESREWNVILYNSKTQQFKKLLIEGKVTYAKPNMFEAIELFIKSLVFVEGGRRKRYEQYILFISTTHWMAPKSNLPLTYLKLSFLEFLCVQGLMFSVSKISYNSKHWRGEKERVWEPMLNYM